MYKGPMAAGRMEYLRNQKRASVAGTERARRRGRDQPQTFLRAVERPEGFEWWGLGGGLNRLVP